MRDILYILRTMRLDYFIASAIVVSLFNVKLAPNNDDFPLTWKMLLTIVVLCEVGIVLSFPNLQDPIILGVTALTMLVAFFTYRHIFSLHKFHKQVAAPSLLQRARRVPASRTKTVAVIGGDLQPIAASAIGNDLGKVQTYFEGVQYIEDHVWTRPSRERNITTLSILYVLAVLSAAICLTLLTIVPFSLPDRTD